MFMELSIIKRESEIIVALFDDDMRLVKPVWEFLKYQRLRGMAHNTIKAYGRDLKIFWTIWNTADMRMMRCQSSAWAILWNFSGSRKASIIQLCLETARANRKTSIIFWEQFTAFINTAKSWISWKPCSLWRILPGLKVCLKVFCTTQDGTTRQNNPFLRSRKAVRLWAWCMQQR